MAAAAAAAAAAPTGCCCSSANAESFGQVLTLLLQMQQHNCVQDAPTFSRLLCVSKTLQQTLLHAAVGCVDAKVPRFYSSARVDQSMVHWLTRHMAHGTLRRVQVEADEFCSYLYLSLAQELESPTAVVPASSSRQLPARRRPPALLISWHVCGLPPTTLPQLPGAQLTHLTLSGGALSASTVRELGRFGSSMRQLHLPNLNPEPGSLAPALGALTSLTQLIIRHPYSAEQAALPVSLKLLVVSQQTPPWTQGGVGGLTPPLQPLRIGHLTALESLTVHEWFPQGISHEYALPSSLQHLAGVFIAAAAPLLGLKRLQTLQLSSLRHSPPEQLLQLSSLTALSAVQLGSDDSAGVARLSYADLRAYARVFAALPVALTGLTVQQHAVTEDPDVGICAASLRALASLRHLVSLSLQGCVLCRSLNAQHMTDAVTPLQLAAALTALPALQQLQLSHLQLRAGSRGTAAVAASGVGSAGSQAETAQAAIAGSSASSSSSSRGSSRRNGANCSSASATRQVASAGAQDMMQAADTAAASSNHAAPRWASEADWRPALAAIASQLPSLHRLTCNGLPLGSAAHALSAAVRLQDLGLHDCDVPLTVVSSLIQQLRASSPQQQQQASCPTARWGSTVAAAGPLSTPRAHRACDASSTSSGSSQSQQTVALVTDRRSTVSYPVCPGGCLTCLRFTRG